jgi:hypothetical protein
VPDNVVLEALPLEVNLIDGTYELFRHYYALPSARSSQGEREVFWSPSGALIKSVPRTQCSRAIKCLSKTGKSCNVAGTQPTRGLACCKCLVQI